MGTELQNREVSWVPSCDVEKNKCFEIYDEYVKRRRTVTHLALEHLETSAHIRRRIKWAAMTLKEDRGDSDVVKQMADTSLIDHINKLDQAIDDYRNSVKEWKEAVKAREEALINPTIPKPPAQPKVGEYTALMRERRLALMDLAKIRGVLDKFGGGGKESAQVNIIMPSGLGRGEGTDTVIVEGKKEELE